MPIRAPWMPEEEELLEELLEKTDMSWDEIAKFFPGRSRGALVTHYSTRLKGEGTSARLRRWTPEEDQLLIQLKEKGGRQSWSQLAEHFPGRSPKAVFSHYSTELEGKTRPLVRWTAEEEQLLIELKEKGLSWSQMLEFFPGRSKDALRSRYFDKLKVKGPDSVRLTRWTPEEDQLLVELKEKKGLKWEQILKSFPHRTLKSIQSRYANYLSS